MFYFHPYLGKIPNLTNIFQMGWFNHHLVNFQRRTNCLFLGEGTSWFKWFMSCRRVVFPFLNVAALPVLPGSIPAAWYLQATYEKPIQLGSMYIFWIILTKKMGCGMLWFLLVGILSKIPWDPLRVWTSQK